MLIFSRHPPQCVPQMLPGWLTVDWNQIFLTTTWLMALNSSPSAPFTYHPILQSLGVSCFAWGEIRPQFLSLAQPLDPNTQES